MPTDITTTVYTYAELIERDDHRAIERARDWLADVSFDTEMVSETLTEAVREAYGPAAEVIGWDYNRGTVEVGGRLARPGVGDGPAFRGWRLGDPYNGGTRDLEVTTEWPAEGDLYVNRDMSSWWDTEASWAADQRDEWSDYVAEVEGVLADLMRAEVEYLTGDEAISEMADANGYTFDDNGHRFG